MKKSFLILMTTILALGILLTGCGNDAPNDTYVSQNTEATTPSETTSSNPLIVAELQSGFVQNGSKTDIIGQYAYIHISKSTMKNITLEEYTEFCETVVDHSIYNWVSIICDDGTGIAFEGSQFTYAVYGTINYEGIIIQEIGTIWQTKTGFEYETLEDDSLQDSQLVTYPLNVASTYSDYASEIPELLFNTTGAENGLAGTIYTFEGTIDEILYSETKEDGITYIFEDAIISTEYGTITLCNFYKSMYLSAEYEYGGDAAKSWYPNVDDYVLPEVGTPTRFIAVYVGYSMANETPTFYLGASTELYGLIGLDDPVASGD